MGYDARHQCLIYDGPPSRQLPALAAAIQNKLDEGYRCLYLNSRPMVAGIRSYLSAAGVDIEKLTAEQRLVLSCQSVLSNDGGFDIDFMIGKLEGALDNALNDGYTGLWATGDMTWEFGSKQNFDKILEYEWRLEDLFRRRHSLCGICQYHRDTLPSDIMRQSLLVHPATFINQTLSRMNPHYIHSKTLAHKTSASSALDTMIVALCNSEDMD